MLKLLKSVTCILLFSLLFACKKKSEPEVTVPADVVLSSATPVASLTKAEMQYRAGFIGFGTALNASINYDSEFIKIVYKTKFNGKVIEASGLLGLPKNGPALPSIISGQHETRFLSVAAPSLFPNSTTGFEVLAAMGYIVVIPDYIGFGSSQGGLRPYYIREYAASAVVDMIRASKEYLKSKSISSSNRLFLFGYSEGGYATLAAQREIELNPSYGLTVTASAAGGGGFDLNTMIGEVTHNNTYSGAAYLALLLNSYNTVYDWKRPVSNFFNEPYAGSIPALLDGTMDGPIINFRLTNDLNALLNPKFLTDLQDNTKELALKQALTKNSFFDWYPKSLTRLYHGTTDEIVPYQSTQATFDAFKAAGATNVTLTPLNGNHYNGSVLMMVDVLPWLKSIDK